MLTLFFGLLSFVAASDKQAEVFTWLSALSGLSTIFCWMAINLSHIRFRQAMKFQERSLDELPFISQTGVWGSIYGFSRFVPSFDSIVLDFYVPNRQFRR